MKITTLGIDLAKNVFQIHGVDALGKVIVKKQLKRDQLAAYLAIVNPFAAYDWDGVIGSSDSPC